MRFDFARRPTHPRTGPLGSGVFVACMIVGALAIGVPAEAQEMVMSLDEGGYVPEEGRVIVPMTCYAETWTDPSGPQMDLSILLTIFVNGEPKNATYAPIVTGWSVSATVEELVEVGLDDVNVRCEGHFVSGSLSDSVVLSGRVPVDLRRVGDDTYQFWKPGSYVRVVTFRVWDNYQKWYSFHGTPVNETFFPLLRNECGIDVITGVGWVNNEALYPDRYGPEEGRFYLSRCFFESYRSCVSEAQQLVSIGPTVFPTRVDYGCYDATIYR